MECQFEIRIGRNGIVDYTKYDKSESGTNKWKDVSQIKYPILFNGHQTLYSQLALKLLNTALPKQNVLPRREMHPLIACHPTKRDIAYIRWAPHIWWIRKQFSSRAMTIIGTCDFFSRAILHSFVRKTFSNIHIKRYAWWICVSAISLEFLILSDRRSVAHLFVYLNLFIARFTCPACFRACLIRWHVVCWVSWIVYKCVYWSFIAQVNAYGVSYLW